MINALIYIVAVLAANYTATWFLPFPMFGQVSVGTLIFGITFTQRDRVHHNGRKWVYVMIAVAALLSTIASLLGHVPARIIIASFTAIMISEIADTEVYQYFIHDKWMFRVLKSNLVSVPLDSTLFNVIAFTGVMSATTIISLIFGEIVLKGITSIVVALKKTKAEVY